jgi:HEAT repeat protein
MDTIPELLQEMHIPSRREAAVQAVLAMGRQAVKPLCRELREGKNPYVREKVAWLLGEFGDRRTRDALLNAVLDDRDEAVREASLTALERLGPTEARAAICNALTARSSVRRRRAAEVLERLGDPAELAFLRPRLSPLFGEQDSAVREAVVSAIRTLEARQRELQLPVPASAPGPATDSLPLPGQGPA